MEPQPASSMSKVTAALTSLAYNPGNGALLDMLAPLIAAVDASSQPPFAGSLHAVFMGPPASPVKSLAQCLGLVYSTLGLLPTAAVTRVSATDLHGSCIGQAACLVEEKLGQALGGVLLIEEAGRLLEGSSPYARDALEALLGRLRSPQYRGKLAVVLAGYEAQLLELLGGPNDTWPQLFQLRMSFPAQVSIQG